MHWINKQSKRNKNLKKHTREILRTKSCFVWKEFSFSFSHSPEHFLTDKKEEKNLRILNYLFSKIGGKMWIPILFPLVTIWSRVWWIWYIFFSSPVCSLNLWCVYKIKALNNRTQIKTVKHTKITRHGTRSIA